MTVFSRFCGSSAETDRTLGTLILAPASWYNLPIELTTLLMKRTVRTEEVFPASSDSLS